MLKLEWALPAVIASTGGHVPSWLQQAWLSDWFRSSIMVGYECWVRLRGTIRATMADKTLSTPQRSEGLFHACPAAGRAAESWWAAGSLAPVQPNAINALRPLWAVGRMETQGCKVCVTHVDMCTHTYTCMGAPVFSINLIQEGKSKRKKADGYFCMFKVKLPLLLNLTLVRLKWFNLCVLMWLNSVLDSFPSNLVSVPNDSD